MPVAAQKDYRELEFPPLNDIVTPTPTRVVLDNGIILYLVEDRRLPLINLSARFGVGAVNEPADKDRPGRDHRRGNAHGWIHEHVGRRDRRDPGRN